jgi:hypothetical protein
MGKLAPLTEEEAIALLKKYGIDAISITDFIGEDLKDKDKELYYEDD